MRSLRDVENSLMHHAPSEETVVDIQEFRAAAIHFASFIGGKVTDGRCKSLAFTKLEEATMWAIKGMVLNE